MTGQALALVLAASLIAGPTASEDQAVEPAATVEPPAPSLTPAPAAPIETDPRNYRMVLAGDIVIGVGGVGLIVMITGLALRSDAIAQRQALASSINPDADALGFQDRRLRTATTLAITGGAATAALFTTGITLVALGYARERKRRESLAWQAIPSPSFGHGQLGLRWQVSF
jgi:hypothetical protein